MDGLLSWISLLGTPERWASDNDSTFVASTIVSLRSLLGIRDEVVPTYSPTTQGAVERAVRTLKEGIDSTILAQSDDDAPIDWPSLLKACVFNANITPRHGGVSPFEVMLGRKPVDTLTATYGIVDERTYSGDTNDYIARLKERLEDIRSYWQSKSMEIKNRTADRECDGLHNDLVVGDHCVRVAYISGRRIVMGQVIVTQKVSGTAYRVRPLVGGTDELCHGYQLIKVPDHPDRPNSSRHLAPDSDEKSYYVISRVIDYHPNKGYLVDWEGYPEPSWQRPSAMPPSFRKEMKRVRDSKRSV